jgi:uncharacterized protein (DUF4213/DUF364 family)
MTGLTLVNGTTDNLLAAVRKDSKVIIMGPSANIFPAALFAQGVSIVGATRITEGETLMKIAGEGGTGYHLFRYCAKKSVLFNHNKQKKEHPLQG